MSSQRTKASSGGQPILWLVCSLSLLWAHMLSCKKCYAPVHILYFCATFDNKTRFFILPQEWITSSYSSACIWLLKYKAEFHTQADRFIYWEVYLFFLHFCCSFQGYYQDKTLTLRLSNTFIWCGSIAFIWGDTSFVCDTTSVLLLDSLTVIWSETPLVSLRRLSRLFNCKNFSPTLGAFRLFIDAGSPNARKLMLSTLGTNFSRRHFGIDFLFLVEPGPNSSSILSPMETIVCNVKYYSFGKNKKKHHKNLPKEWWRLTHLCRVDFSTLTHWTG